MGLTNFPNGISSMGMPVSGGGNPFGTTYFVDYTNGSDGNKGKSTNKPFKTIQQVLDVGSAGDNVILSPGTHYIDTGTDGAMVPLADMSFIAAIPPCGGMPSTVITADADDLAAMVTVDVDGVSFHGIKFLLVAGATTAVDLFDIAQTTAVNGLVFQDCWFDLNSCDHATAIMRALAIDDGTNATTGLVVKNCRFLGGDATTTEAEYIVTGVGGIPDALIEDNVFCLQSDDGDAVGINIGDPGAGDKNYAMLIRNNDFIGAMDGGADSVGIKFGGLDELEVIGSIRTNYFAYCSATAVTIDKMNKGVVWNYVGDNATGGTLVDPGT